MRTLYELCSMESDFEMWLSVYLEALKKHNDNMRNEKDIFKLKDILKTLNSLEHELDKHKKLLEEAADKLDDKKTERLRQETF